MNRKSLTQNGVTLAREFKVSAATVRTDLHVLQRAGLLIRTHGGAIEKTKTGFELDSHHREVQHLPQKERIARAALELVEDGDILVLDTGTTTFELAKLLHKKKNITVITNDLPIARQLEEAESITVLLMGGMVRKGFHCTVGVPGRELAAGLTADKAFMAANSFSLEKGATTPDLHHAQTKQHMLSVASKIILLCDSSKLGKVSFAQFARAEEIDILVTDHLDDRTRLSYEQRDIEVIIAHPAGK